VLEPLILLTGPDGAGKTTLALMLKKYLEKKGYKVKIVRIRGTHTFAYIFMLTLRDLLGLKGRDLHYYNVRIPSKLTSLWTYIELISIIPLVMWYYYILRLRYIVISERSIIDALVWLLTGLQETRLLIRSRAIRVYLALIKKLCKHTMYVTAGLKILESRKPNEAFLIRAMLVYYSVFAKTFRLKITDTTASSLPVSFKHIRDLLEKYYET